MTDSSWVGLDKSNTDLRHADLRGKVLFQTNLRGANLYGAHITLNCDTFDAVALDSRQVATLLRLIALADIGPQWKQGILALTESIVGKAQNEAIARYLQVDVKTP